MQQVVTMVDFKFTIGINKLFKSICRNQKNKKPSDPLKLKAEDLTQENILTCCESNLRVIVAIDPFCEYTIVPTQVDGDAA